MGIITNSSGHFNQGPRAGGDTLMHNSGYNRGIEALFWSVFPARSQAEAALVAFSET